MIGRRTLAMGGIGILGLSLLVLFLLTPGPLPQHPGAPSPGAASPSIPPGPSQDPIAPLVDPVTVVDGRYDAQPNGTVHNPSEHKNQSKLFYAHGSWWGVLQEPTSREARIQRLDWSTQRWHDTGVVVDERPTARADVLYSGDTLYVASAASGTSPVQAVRISAFGYVAASGRWALKPDFPVTISSVGVSSSLIERAADGTLWAAWIADGRLLVTHSTTNDHRWVVPYRPAVAGTDTTGADTTTEQVGMVTVGDEVVLLWSNQVDDAVFTTSHREGTGDDVWAPATIVLKGLRLADNHVNVKALPDGRLFAAIKTSLDTVPAAQPGWDQVLLLDRQGDAWSSQQFGQIRDKHTRPIVVLDTEHNEVLVFATSPTGGGQIYMKSTWFDAPRFEVGQGAPVLATADAPDMNNATSTKQAVDATTGLIVLATDESIGRYVHLAASLGGPSPGVPPSGAPPDGPVAAAAGPVDLVLDSMDAFTVGDRVQPSWRTTPTRSGGSVTYVSRSGPDLAVAVRTTGTGELRPCRSFGTTSRGNLDISMDVRLDRQGAQDTMLLMVRGDNQELGAVRVDAQLRVRVSRLGNRETTSTRIAPGRWYHVDMTLDIAKRTFSMQLSDAAGKRLLRRADQAWRAAGVTSVDGLCVAPSVGTRGAGMSFDEVRVTRRP
jgi:hypothetical protein